MYHIEQDRVINSLKTTVACVIAYFATDAFHLPMAPWVLLTVLVLMSSQIHVGGVVIKSWYRFFGTMLGALIAGVSLRIFPNEMVPNLAVLAISIFFFTYAASSNKDVSNVGQLGAVTVMVILLTANPTHMTAVIRFLQISLGIFIAFLVTQFIWPLRARDKIRTNIAQNLQDFALILKLIWDPKTKFNQIMDRETEVLGLFEEQRKLIKEATNEFSTHPIHQSVYEKMLACQRSMFRNLYVMHETLDHTCLKPALAESLASFNESVQSYFQQLEACMRNPKRAQLLHDLSNTELVKIIENYNDFAHIDPEHPLAMPGFFFCYLALVKQLRKFARLVNIFVENS